jgi:hypothetical protein
VNTLRKTNVFLGEMAMRHYLSTKKSYNLIVLLIFFIVSIACRTPDAIQVIINSAINNCRNVSRTAYEKASYKLGQIPETPEDEETAVYQICYADGQIVSAKMFAGYKSEEDEAVDPPTKIMEGANTSSNTAGTYLGEFWEVPPSWELVIAEFIIVVAEDGTVSGTKKYQIERVSADYNCTTRWENGHTTLINGHLIDGTNGLVSVQTDAYTIWDSSDCGGVNSHNTHESVCDVAQITISGNKMEIRGDGSEGCGFNYSATRQAAP